MTGLVRKVLITKAGQKRNLRKKGGKKEAPGNKPSIRNR